MHQISNKTTPWTNETEENTDKTDTYGDLCRHAADVWIQKWRRTCALPSRLVYPRVTLNSAPFASWAVAAHLEDAVISWFLLSSGHRRAQLVCLLLYLYSTCQTLNKHFFLDWIVCSGVYSSEWWSQEKGTFSVWRALNLYSSTTIRWSIEIFKKRISDPWGGISVCDNSWQGSSARMRRYNRPSRILPSSQNFATVQQRDKDVMLRNFFGSAAQASGGAIID